MVVKEQADVRTKLLMRTAYARVISLKLTSTKDEQFCLVVILVVVYRYNCPFVILITLVPGTRYHINLDILPILIYRYHFKLGKCICVCVCEKCRPSKFRSEQVTPPATARRTVVNINMIKCTGRLP